MIRLTWNQLNKSNIDSLDRFSNWLGIVHNHRTLFKTDKEYKHHLIQLIMREEKRLDRINGGYQEWLGRKRFK